MEQQDVEDASKIRLPERIKVIRDAGDGSLRVKRRKVSEALPTTWAVPQHRRARPLARRHTRPPHLLRERQELGIHHARPPHLLRERSE
jgi:hypothetical protein